MEENFYHRDFEDLIKDKADQYKMYPSDKVWKNINRSLRSRKRWYWTGFVILLSGVSYISVIELLKPPITRIAFAAVPVTIRKPVSIDQFIPFSPATTKAISAGNDNAVLSKITMEDGGSMTASFDIPMQMVDASSPVAGKRTSPVPVRGSLLIEGLAPLAKNEMYRIDVSVPSPGKIFSLAAGEQSIAIPASKTITLAEAQAKLNRGENWLEEQALLQLPTVNLKHIGWQLAFSPTVNYRKLSGGSNASIGSSNRNIPLSLQIQGNINSLVNHRPALGFELGTHGFFSLTNRFTLKAGVQFNYAKYDIRAYRTASELATISLNPSEGRNLNSLTSYTDIRNFGGSAVDNLKNQYFQLSLPVGLELKVLGNDRLQFDIAGTLQPTYLLNKNSYLITTDYKNYTKAPSLITRWNMNAGAEAYLSYNRGDIKWQIGPQFRYQLFSSYDKSYPIKEYLLEYGIKIGITKTIR